MVKRFIQTWNKTNLMKRIAIGIFVGALLALLLPQASAIGLLGEIFVGEMCIRDSPSPEIRDDLVFTSLARGIQEELFTQEQFHFIAETILSDKGVEKEIDKIGLSTLERSFRALIYANLLTDVYKRQRPHNSTR